MEGSKTSTKKVIIITTPQITKTIEIMTITNQEKETGYKATQDTPHLNKEDMMRSIPTYREVTITNKQEGSTLPHPLFTRNPPIIPSPTNKTASRNKQHITQKTA